MADHNVLDDCEHLGYPARSENYGWALIPGGPNLYAPDVVPALALNEWLHIHHWKDRA